MAIMANLTEEDVLKQKKFFKDHIQDRNPEASLKFFDMGMKPESDNRKYKSLKSDNDHIKELSERVESLEMLIRATFAGHVLINGQFVKITI